MDFFELFVLLDHLLNLNETERKKFSCLNFQNFAISFFPWFLKCIFGNFRFLLVAPDYNNVQKVRG